MAACIAAASFPAGAAEVLVTVKGARGPVAGAVVSLRSPASQVATRPGAAQMDQRKSRFVPDLLVVQAGSEVTFPNSDNIRHNVYSFSPTKRFELPLYSGRPLASVRFNTPGVVAVGCNIHDWMVAHIVVLDTPQWGVSDTAGQVRLEAPPGRYALRAWHPRLSTGAMPASRPVMVGEANGAQVIVLPGPPPGPGAAPPD